MAKDNVLIKAPFFDYEEKLPKIDAKEFQKVIDSRRSVRIFENETIPEDIVERCLQNAVLAPNSSNLQPWEFYRIKSPDKKKAMVYACLNQIAAKTAAELFVVICRTDTWKKNAKDMIDLFKKKGNVADSVFTYYGKLVPAAYTQGVFSTIGFLKRILYFFIGLKKPIIREPVSNKDLHVWAAKTAALGAQNLMMSLRAYGYDSCPMEGADSKRIKKILGLGRGAKLVMVIAAGKRAKGGVYGSRVRFDSSRFIKTV
jgi:nitroreductase